MKKIDWPTALVVSVGILGVVALTLLHAETTDLMLVIITLVGGVGAQQIASLRQNTNGNLSRLLDIIEKQAGIATPTTDTTTPPAQPEP